MILVEKKESTPAQKERGSELLKSIKTLVNVIFALFIFQIFMILPRPDDPELVNNTLGNLLSNNLDKLLVIVVGLIFIIIYWLQFNLLSGNLKRSTPRHSVLAIIQIIFLMIYLYFLRFDLEFDGYKLALQMESIFLALAGFVGAVNWNSAKHSGLLSETISDTESDDILYKILPEPIASAFTLPFAQFGPGIWTLSFLVIIPITMILKRVRKSRDAKK